MKRSSKNSNASSSPPDSGKAKAAKARAQAAAAGPEIPSILLEGDTTPTAPVSGPGERYVLGPVPPEGTLAPTEGRDLPEAYGTKQLLLTARDPHWLYAHWDLTRNQQGHYNQLSTDGHLVLRIYREDIQGEPFSEIHVHPESRNWFAHVGLGGTRFQAELGYYARKGKWVQVSRSSATLTPPDTMSDDCSIAFETLPADLQLKQLLELVKTAVSHQVPLMEAIQQLRATGHQGLPERPQMSARQWTPEQEAILTRLINMDSVRRVWMGSLEITEVLRRQLHEEMWSAAAAQLAQAGLWSGAVSGISSISSISSPYGVRARPKGFWFNVNAELVIYGATEPDAHVSIGGRPIKLRQDGTFSYRFSLPDGNYFLPAIATSADHTDQRVAELEFRRHTQYQGDVGKHPQDARLKPPEAENVS